MTLFANDRRKSLFLNRLESFLEVYIFPDVFIILEPLENDDDWFYLAFSDENDEIIYETKIQIHGTESIDFEGIKDIGSMMKKDKRYLPGTLFQELADALCMYHGILLEANLITIINNYLPYFDELPNHSNSANKHMNDILADAMNIEEAPAFLCCSNKKCVLTDSLYDWITKFYQEQQLVSDSNGIWAHHAGYRLCPVFLHSDDTKKIGDIISVSQEELKTVNFHRPEELDTFLHHKYDEYLKDLKSSV